MQPTSNLSHELSVSKGVNILARTLFREMKEQGYRQEQIIGLSTELIHLVNEELQKHIAAE